MPSKVISVGADPELLWLRHAVLETAGFDVRSALGEDDAFPTIHAVQCGTLLMCYSLSKRARKSLAQEFRRYCPKARIIAITNQKLDGPDYADSFVYGVEGPETLIQTISNGEAT